jgi:peroxiredoxin
MAAVYSLLGMIAAPTGTLFGSISTSPLALLIVANILLLFALNMLGVIPFPAWFQGQFTKPAKGGLAGAVLIGAASGLVASPCTSPVLFALLTYVATNQSVLYGGILLFAFSMGMGLLLIVAGTFSGLAAALPKPGSWTAGVKKVLGLLMLGLAEYYLIKADRPCCKGADMTAKAKIFWVVMWFLMAAVSPGWGVEVGEPVPDFSIETFDGTNLSRATLAGKPMLFIFWNTWCPTCKKELPKINRLAERFGPKEVAVLAINTGLNDNGSKARAYWKKYGYGFPVGFDHSFKIGQAFKVRGVPTVFLVDAKGIVRYKSPQFPDDIEERLKKLALP